LRRVDFGARKINGGAEGVEENVHASRAWKGNDRIVRKAARVSFPAQPRDAVRSLLFARAALIAFRLSLFARIAGLLEKTRAS
jgi:hypothetical protein